METLPDPGPKPAGPPADDDQVARRLRELADRWQRDPGVWPSEDLVLRIAEGDERVGELVRATLK